MQYVDFECTWLNFEGLDLGVALQGWGGGPTGDAIWDQYYKAFFPEPIALF